MPEIQYKVVDVFSKKPLHGNPVAVFNLFNTPPDQIPNDATLGKIASWLNLSETTFILPASDNCVADYKLRIFTPTSELPFAGHPTLGSAYAAIEYGIVDLTSQPDKTHIVQECGVGLIDISLEMNKLGSVASLKLTMPIPEITDLTEQEAQTLADALKVSRDKVVSTPAVVNVGISWTIVQLDSVDTLLSLNPDMAAIVAIDREVTAYANYKSGEKAGVDVEVRTFVPTDNVNEDPVCGSGNGSVGIYKRIRGDNFDPHATDKASYVSNQGQCLGRQGVIQLGFNQTKDRVTVGGKCVTTVNGTLSV
ncbi:phenazine biosynthesis protein PhzF family [Nadsonia fulvescens var. elongata DSM 6958]|uniref:Phenazine biosynthesis protein PhzF family n=1 Tax=Nadsonia fulvescens var. elongata DSM 6958 TaxID=857566 RepID=A0A1E3PJW4_9ASCO|nr:phenazine biosynthesis protein PhzF family [Nadsonia fulvescens var. elongata DSM 6958]